ncbi:YybH family protein [Spirosoma flavum]|uniref:YybH family protein n=1 Tax=Spirosoma flavum TaxID=2048557 RepID=A0ABW6AF61_9BACT
MKYFLGIALIAVSFTACSPSGETVNIQDLNRQFIDAWNNKNADKITSLLAEDMDFLQGNAHYKGKADVTKQWVQATLPTLTNLKTNVISSATDTHTAYEAGTFAVDLLPEAPNQPRAFGEGNFILLWKKGDDGVWKLSYAQLEDLPVQAKN